MSTLKIALIATGVALTLATAANAFELRPGNGTSTITVSPPTDRAAVGVSQDRGASRSVETLFGRGNGMR